MRPDTQPEILVDKTYNLAVPFTTAIPSFKAQGGASSNNLLVTNFDVDRGEIAHYRLAVLDHGINVQVQQPGGLSRFTDKSGTRRLNSANTLYYNYVGEWGGMCEFWLFQDNTPVTFTVTSSNLNSDSYHARIKVIGFKYQLIKVKPKNPRAEPRVVLTVDVGQRQK